MARALVEGHLSVGEPAQAGQDLGLIHEGERDHGAVATEELGEQIDGCGV